MQQLIYLILNTFISHHKATIPHMNSLSKEINKKDNSEKVDFIITTTQFDLQLSPLPKPFITFSQYLLDQITRSLLLHHHAPASDERKHMKLNVGKLHNKEHKIAQMPATIISSPQLHLVTLILEYTMP